MVSGERERKMVLFVPRKENNLGEAVCREQSIGKMEA